MSRQTLDRGESMTYWPTAAIVTAILTTSMDGVAKLIMGTVALTALWMVLHRDVTAKRTLSKPVPSDACDLIDWLDAHGADTNHTAVRRAADVIAEHGWPKTHYEPHTLRPMEER